MGDESTAANIMAALQALNEATGRVDRKVDALDALIDTSRNDQVELRTEMAALKGTVAELNRTLHHSNGKESVMTRLFVLEQSRVTDIETTTRALADVVSRLNRWGEKAQAREKADREGRWKLWVAVLGGLMGIVGTVAAALLRTP